MPGNSTALDPYRPTRGYYECLVCGDRATSVDSVSECERCGGEVRNIAVARE